VFVRECEQRADASLSALIFGCNDRVAERSAIEDGTVEDVSDDVDARLFDEVDHADFFTRVAKVAGERPADAAVTRHDQSPGLGDRPGVGRHVQRGRCGVE